MTLVLSDRETASRDCENGVLGAFWMSTCPSTGREALECDEWGFESANGVYNRLVMKIKPRKSASSGSGCVRSPRRRACEK